MDCPIWLGADTDSVARAGVVNLIADKGYDNDGLRAHLADAKVDTVILSLGSSR